MSSSIPREARFSRTFSAWLSVCFQLRAAAAACEGPDGKQRHQRRLLFRKQHLENPKEQFGGRRSLGKQVEPVGEAPVALFERDVRHGRELRGVQGAALHREL
jgi:hypothetical protein